MNDRNETILKLLRIRQYMTVRDFCEALSASPATVRRALACLDEQGQLRYINGGALLLQPEMSAYPSMHKEKHQIARAALAYVQPGDTLFMDAGSTNNVLADYLIDIADLQVVTNSIYIAYRLYAAHDRIRVCVCGGNIGAEPSALGAVVGELAESLVKNIRANLFFMGCSAISAAQGVTDPNMPAARLKQSMMENAQRTVLLCDHTKLGRVHMAYVAPVSAIHDMLTDAQADTEQLAALREAGMSIKTT